jgi:hypothetical protein
MSLVYTRRFLAAGALRTNLFVTVPAGKIWVVRCVTGVAGKTAADQVLTAAHGGVASFAGFFQPANANPVPLVWVGYYQMNAGENLYAVPNAGTWDVTMTGYEFNA